MFEPLREFPDFSDDQTAAWEAITERMARHGVEVEAGETTPKTEGDLVTLIKGEEPKFASF